MRERLLKDIPASERGKGARMISACQVCTWEDRWEDFGVGYRAAAASRAQRHTESAHAEYPEAEYRQFLEPRVVSEDLGDVPPFFVDEGIARAMLAAPVKALVPFLSPFEPRRVEVVLSADATKAAQEVKDINEAFRRLYENAPSIGKLRPIRVDEPLELLSVGLVANPTNPNCAISPFQCYRHVDGKDTPLGVTCMDALCKCRSYVAAVTSA